jgi:hypothetical protein
MNQIGLTILLVGFQSVDCFAQDDVNQELPNVFRKFYRIKDKQDGKYWDMKSSGDYQGNIFCNSSFYGVDNQQWMIMPKIPNSSEFVLLSKKDGRIIDRHHSNNIYGASDIHLGGNQIFKFSEISSSYYSIICSDVFLTFDRSKSGLTRDPFQYPSSYSNNLYCGNVLYADNQQFKFEELIIYPIIRIIILLRIMKIHALALALKV